MRAYFFVMVGCVILGVLAMFGYVLFGGGEKVAGLKAECRPGDSRPCGTDLGECVRGLQTCSGGRWGKCAGEVIGIREVCDVLDNDCDGTIDEGLLNACGTCGPTPPEMCGDGLDNDCDGRIDDGCDGSVVYGSLTVTSTPVHGAATELDGEPTGMTTPHTFENLPVGAHAVLLSHPGWLDAGELSQPTEVNVTAEGATINVPLYRDLTGVWRRESDGLESAWEMRVWEPDALCPDGGPQVWDVLPVGRLCVQTDGRVSCCKTHAAECGMDSAEGFITEDGRRVEFTTHPFGVSSVYNRVSP